MSLEPIRRVALAAPSSSTQYPRVSSTRPLAGLDGNAYAILGQVSRGLRDAGATEDEVAAFVTLATAGDYDQLLRVAMAYTAEPTEGEL